MQMLDKVTECDVTKSHNRRRDYWRGVSGAVFSDRERSFRWWSLLTFLTLKSPPRSPFNWEKCSIWNFPFFWLLKFHKPNLSPPQFMKLKNKSAEPICSSTQRTLFFFFLFSFFWLGHSGLNWQRGESGLCLLIICSFNEDTTHGQYFNRLF